MSKNGLMIRPGNVVIEIFPPVETARYTRSNKDELMEKVYSVIAENFEKGKVNYA